MTSEYMYAIKATRMVAFLGDPCMGRDVAVADGQDGHVAEIEQITETLPAGREPGKRARLMELHGDEDEKTAVPDEEQAAQRREHAFPVHQRGRVDLPEEFERHPPEEHDIGEYKILAQIQGREAVQQAPDDEQAAEEDQQGQEVSLPPDIEEGDPRDELDRQVDGLRDAVVDVFGEEDVDDDRAQE